MAYKAAIIADSVTTRGERLTTFEVALPRIVLAEFNTHRVFSRNSASSRAIPVEKQLARVLDDPFMPVYWGINQSGMQAANTLDMQEERLAISEWLMARDYAVLASVMLVGGIDMLKDDELRRRVTKLQTTLIYGGKGLPTPLHKQIANRLLEPFMWHTIIVTATEWSNFFALRASPMAQPEIQKAAHIMKSLYATHTPLLLGDNDWHLPLIQTDEFDLPVDDLKKMSVGRCARVSYLTHDTGERDVVKDIQLHDTLKGSGHMSPFEHVSRPMSEAEFRSNAYSGNFRGWHQYRKDVPGENDFSLVK